MTKKQKVAAGIGIAIPLIIIPALIYKRVKDWNDGRCPYDNYDYEITDWNRYGIITYKCPHCGKKIRSI